MVPLLLWIVLATRMRVVLVSILGLRGMASITTLWRGVWVRGMLLAKLILISFKTWNSLLAGKGSPHYAAGSPVVEELHHRSELEEVHLIHTLLVGDHLHHNNRLKTFLWVTSE